MTGAELWSEFLDFLKSEPNSPAVYSVIKFQFIENDAVFQYYFKVNFQHLGTYERISKDYEIEKNITRYNLI